MRQFCVLHMHMIWASSNPSIATSATSTGSGVSHGSGSKSAPQSGSGVSGIPALMTSERCILAASKTVGDGDNKVGNLAPSGSLLLQQLIPPLSINNSGSVPSRCAGAFMFGSMSSPGAESGSA